MHYLLPIKVFILWLILFLSLKFSVPMQEIAFVQLKEEPEYTLTAYLIKDNLHYQSCDDAKCYFPRDLPFTMKINIE